MIPGAYLLPGDHLAADEPRAPPLPTEGHAVAAALELAEVRERCNGALLLLRHAPRADADIRHAFADMQRNLTAAWESYSAFCELLSCEGQA